MKIFVISLLGSNDRRKSIQKQMESAGLNFEFIDAVNGSTLTDEDIARECDPKALADSPRWLNKGAIGCAMTHRQAYEKIIEQNLRHALIVEDDVILPQKFSEMLDELEKQLHDDEINLLYYRGFKTIHFSTRAARPVGKDHQILFPVDKENIPMSAVAYIVPLAVCPSLIKATSPIKLASDSWDVFLEQNVFKKISVVFPRPVQHANFKSDIDYVGAYNSKLVSTLSKVIDQYKIPIVYGLLKRRRAQTETEMSHFALTDKPSIFEAGKLI